MPKFKLLQNEMEKNYRILHLEIKYYYNKVQLNTFETNSCQFNFKMKIEFMI